MSNDLELRSYEDVRRVLTEVLDFVVGKEQTAEHVRLEEARSAADRLEHQAELYRLKALRACCDAALLCADGDNLAARPVARGVLAAVDAWHEQEKRRHEEEEERKREARRSRT